MDIASRENFLGYDKYGIDPLRDQKFYQLAKVEKYILYIVEQQYEARPDLLALDFYRNENFWWIIMQYNGLLSYKDVTAGSVLKIPDPLYLSREFSVLTDKRPSDFTSTVVEV